MDQFSRQQRMKTLFEQWCHNTIAEKDVQELMQLLEEPGMDNEAGKLSQTAYFQQEDTPFFTPAEKRKMFLNIVKPVNVFRRRLMYMSGIAAGIALVVGVGSYLLHKKGMSSPTHVITGNDIAAPTVSIGLLKPENSSSIHFEDAPSGLVADQENVKIIKYADGTLAFSGSTTRPVSNTLTVPKGSKPVHLLLADGTSILLNAASGITFPNAFTGNERTVSLYGEAYFEVKHDPAHPFIVKLGKSNVKVLGTHFNIRSYNDDVQTKITLIEGKVNVNNGMMLKPGQQAVVENGMSNLLLHPDMEEALAWKNNEFNFNGWDVPAILSMLSQWYNFTIEYKTKIPTGHFSGSIKRDNNLSQVLRILETGGLQFKIEKNKLIVY
ncbi:FecR family protein [Chitinophaga sp.]|uniref:FecR family protein n=1 Tax=Chitinophaga sp. TaxID=1869181 RepID=UPI002F94FA9B